MSWQTWLAEDEKVALVIDGQLHWMPMRQAQGLAESIKQLEKHADRVRALRASKAAQALVKQENARHQ